MFSQRALPVVHAFARSMALPALFAEDGSCSFAFARLGLLSLVPAAGERVLVSLAWAPGFADPAREAGLFALAGPDAALGVLVHAGRAENGSFVLTIDLPEEWFDEPMLDQAIRHLGGLRDQL